MTQKSLFAAVMLLGTLLTATAQEIIFSQDFESNADIILTEGWKIIGFTGETTNNGIFNASPSIQAIGFEGKTIGGATFAIVNQIPTHIPDADSATQSPFIEIPAGQSQLSFRVGSVNIGGDSSSHYSVYTVAAEDLGTIENNTQLKALLDGTEALDSATISGESSVVTVSTSAFAERTVAFFFRLHNTAGNNLLLFDEISVTAGTMGNPDNETANVMLYPNPVKDMLTLNTDGNTVVKAITVYSISGQKVSATLYDSAAQSYSLNLGSIAAGVYIVKVMTSGGTLVKRMVKS